MRREGEREDREGEKRKEEEEKKEKQNSQFNMQDYLDILLRRWKLIVISFVVTAVIATLVGFKLPRHTAQAPLF